MLQKQINRLRRKVRVGSTIHGTAERPRLSVFRSATHIYAQLVDDDTGKTLASASDLKAKAAPRVAKASEVGKTIAEAGKKAGVTEVVFDRGGFAYHGRVKALADAAREGGLKF